MSVKLLFLGTATREDIWEDIEYSPPKDPMDISNFNDIFASGSYSLPEEQKVEKDSHLVHQAKRFCMRAETPAGKPEPRVGSEDLRNADLLSDSESLKNGAQTATTASPLSTYSTHGSSLLRKRSPQKAEWVASQVSITEYLLPEPSRETGDKDLFVKVIIGADLANERVAKLAIRVLDQKSSISDEEWHLLSFEDRYILVSYLMPKYGLPVPKNLSLDSPRSLNELLTMKLKGRRNEEKLNRTVKHVNCLIAQSFSSLNQLEDLEPEQLATILQQAYFGGSVGQETNIFAPVKVCSQKGFGKAVTNERYAEDFQAMLNNSYMEDFLISRKRKTLKEVKTLRRKLEEGKDIAIQEHNKRPHWMLTDIVEGAILCQNIIEKKQIS